MKKIFTLALLAVTMLTANAQQKWDFTNWSDGTKAQLAKSNAANFADDVAQARFPENGWSAIEKKTGAITDAKDGICYWESTAHGTTSGEELTIGDYPIPELKGLLYTNTTARSLAIALDYTGYHGSQFLWLGSKSINYFVIPNVPAKAKITIGVESHKLTESRGIYLCTVGKGSYAYDATTKLSAPDGSQNNPVKDYTEQTWLVPNAGTTNDNGDGTFNVLIYNTNGCHMYFIEYDDPSAEKDDILFITKDKNNPCATYKAEDGIDSSKFNVTLVGEEDAAPATRADWAKYKAIVIGEDVAIGSDVYTAYADSAAFFIPTIDLSMNILAAEEATITDEQAFDGNIYLNESGNNIWDKMESIEESGKIEYGEFHGFKLYSAFSQLGIVDTLAYQVADGKKYPVLAEILGKRNAIYTCTMFTGENASSEFLTPLLQRAINTGASLTHVATPKANLTYEQGKTSLTFTCETESPWSKTEPVAVYYKTSKDADYAKYTIGKSEPTVYTEGTTVYYYAKCIGYLDSDTASTVVELKECVPTPVITQKQEEGKTTIYITDDEEDCTLYYSFGGITDPALATQYDDAKPIEITESGEITVTAVPDQAGVLSTSKTYDVTVEGGPREIMELSHFNPNATNYYTNGLLSVAKEGEEAEEASVIEAVASKWHNATGNSSALYFFGKSAYGYDEEAGIVNYYVGSSSCPWVITSHDQVVCGELTLDPLSGVGHDSGTQAGRYAYQATDELNKRITTGFIDFNGKTEGAPYTLSVESAESFSGKVKFLAYLGNGNSDASKFTFEVEKSTDYGKTWETVKDENGDTIKLNYAPKKRYWTKTVKYADLGETAARVRVRQTDGNSKAQLYDFYIYAVDELPTPTGIREVKTAEESAAQTTVKYVDADGRLVIKTANGATYNVAGQMVK